MKNQLLSFIALCSIYSNTIISSQLPEVFHFKVEEFVLVEETKHADIVWMDMTDVSAEITPNFDSSDLSIKSLIVRIDNKEKTQEEE